MPRADEFGRAADDETTAVRVGVLFVVGLVRGNLAKDDERKPNMSVVSVDDATIRLSRLQNEMDCPGRDAGANP